MMQTVLLVSASSLLHDRALRQHRTYHLHEIRGLLPLHTPMKQDNQSLILIVDTIFGEVYLKFIRDVVFEGLLRHFV